MAMASVRMKETTLSDEVVEVGDETLTFEAGDQKPPTANNSSEKLNASAMRIVNSAKKRALNNSAVRKHQTLKANNTALARSLSLAKEEVKILRHHVTSLRFENHDLQRQLTAANSNALYDQAVQEAVKTRVLEIMSEVEEEYGEAKERFLYCLGAVTRLNNEFREASILFRDMKQPMARLNKVIKKYTDDAGEFLIDGGGAGAGSDGAEENVVDDGGGAGAGSDGAEENDEPTKPAKRVTTAKRKTTAVVETVVEKSVENVKAKPKRSTAAAVLIDDGGGVGDGSAALETEERVDEPTAKRGTRRKTTTSVRKVVSAPSVENATGRPKRNTSVAIDGGGSVGVSGADENVDEPTTSKPAKRGTRRKTTAVIEKATSMPSVENGKDRPKRTTAVTTYKEPSLTFKLRREVK